MLTAHLMVLWKTQQKTASLRWFGRIAFSCVFPRKRVREILQRLRSWRNFLSEFRLVIILFVFVCKVDALQSNREFIYRYFIFVNSGFAVYIMQHAAETEEAARMRSCSSRLFHRNSCMSLGFECNVMNPLAATVLQFAKTFLDKFR